MKGIIYLLVSITVFFFSITAVSAQARKIISGKVLTDDKTVLPGITVTESGTSNRVLTDGNGNFTISISGSGNQMRLRFESVGYVPQEVDVSKVTIVTVILMEDFKQLDDVVVVGYGSTKKSDITGSLTSIRASDLNQLPTQRVDQALQGRAAGVMVLNTDGAPGGNTTIRIRGMNSIYGGNNALIVIDGQQGGNINTIDPNDIESMEVLKDASATAIYGSKGANGVILIATKAGKIGKPALSYSYKYGMQDIAKKLDLLNAPDFAKKVNAQRMLGNFNGQPTPVFSDAEIASFEKNGGTDWQDEIYQIAPLQNHQLSLTGGSELIKYFFSSGYLDQKGILKNSDYNRFNIRTNLNVDFNKWVSADMKLVLIKSVGNIPPFGDEGGATDVNAQAILIAPTWGATIPVYDADGNYSRHPVRYGNANTWNPVASALETSTKNALQENSLNVNFDFKILKGLTFKITGSGIFSNENNRRFFNDKTFDGRFYNGYAGLGRLYNSKNEQYQNSNILTYNRQVNEHRFTFTAVAEQQLEKFTSNGLQASGFTVIETGLDDLAGANTIINESNSSKRILNSYLGRINYSFKDKYLLTASYRADGSSVFGKNNKWGYFPSMAGAWKVSEEGFLQNSDLFSDFKVRASWGMVGNQGIEPYQTLSAMSSGYNYPYSGSNITDLGFLITRAQNPSLKWESTTQTNFGIDFGLFSGRLSGTVDLYKKNTNDLLMARDLAYYTGLPSIIDNVGSTTNKGLEISVSGDPIVGAFAWNTGFNVSWNKNKVVSMGDTKRMPFSDYGGGYGVANLMYLVEGQPFGQMYGFGTNGIWKESERKEALAFGQLPGDQHYIDLNNDGLIDINDQMVIGNALPKYIFGWSNRLSYKGLGLSFLVQGVNGNDIFNMQRINLESPGSGTSSRLNNRWTIDNQNTDIPAFTDEITRENANLTSKVSLNSLDENAISRYIEDGSYIRLKNVTVDYNIPVSVSSRFGARKLKAFVSATNLITITKYTGYDPEVSSFNGNDAQLGIDQGNYPTNKTFTFGLEILF